MVLAAKNIGIFCSWQLAIIGFVDGTLFDFTKYPINHKSYFSFDYCDTEKNTKLIIAICCIEVILIHFPSTYFSMISAFFLTLLFQLDNCTDANEHFQLNIFGIPAVLFSLIQCIFPASFQLIIFASIKFKSLDHINDVLIIYFIFPQ